MSEPGNTNALRNGRRSVRNGIVLAALSDRHASIAVDLRRLKRTLDPYVQQRQGAERLKAIAMANEIARWEISARIMQKTMATEALNPELALSYLNGIGQATARRNALLNKLLANGKAAGADPWALLDSPRGDGGDSAASGESQADPGEKAPQANPRGDGGNGSGGAGPPADAAQAAPRNAGSDSPTGTDQEAKQPAESPTATPGGMVEASGASGNGMADQGTGAEAT